MKKARSFIDNCLNKKEKHRKQLAAVVSLSMLISFTVPVALQEPGISQTKDSFTPVSDVISTQLFNTADGNSIPNLKGAEGNDGYSPASISDITLLIGDGSELAQGANSVADVIRNAQNKYFLGIASDFCVFLKEDFIPKESDAEGRVAVGGNVDFQKGGLDGNYQIGAGDFENGTALKNTDNYRGISGFAHLITNGQIVNRVSPYSTKHTNAGYSLPDAEDDLYKRFVVSSNFDYNNSTHSVANEKGKGHTGDTIYDNSDGHKHFYNSWNDLTNATDEKAQFYQTPYGQELINFEEQFDWLQAQANALAKVDPIVELEWDKDITIEDGKSVIHFTGPGEDADDETVYFKIDKWDWIGKGNPCRVYFDEIPPNANIVLTCEADYFSAGAPSNDVHIYINGENISNGRTITDNDEYKNNNNHPDSERILFNFPNATSGKIGGNTNGTIFAPQAAIDGNNGHLSGALIAKSFEGTTEFGYRPYRGPASLIPSSSGYGVPIRKIIAGTKNENNPNGTPLENAVFGIFKEENGTVNGTAETSFKSNEYGEGYVNIPSQVQFDGSVNYKDKSISNEIESTYIIQETEAPAGFVIDNLTRWKIGVKETVDRDSVKEMNGNSIPTKVKTEITIYNSKGEITDEFTIDSEDIYSSTGADAFKLTSRLLTVKKGNNNAEQFLMNMQDGSVMCVGVVSGAPEAITTQVSSLETKEVTSSYTTMVNVTNEAGQTVTEVETSIVYPTTAAAGDKKGTYYNNFEFGWSGNVLSNTERTYTVTLYSVDDNGDISSEVKEKTEGNQWYTPVSQWWGNLDNIVGFTIETNNNENFSDEKITIKGDKINNGNKEWIEETFDFSDGLFKWGTTSTDKPTETETTTTTTSVTIVSSWNVTTQTVVYENVMTNTYVASESVVLSYPTETIAGLASKSQNYKINETFTTPISEYQFDPSNKMIMPMPSEAPTFENDYGLNFMKISKSGDKEEPITEVAVIDIRKDDKNDNDDMDSQDTVVISDILGGKSSATIDLTSIIDGETYYFIETAAPANHETAKNIYFKKSGNTITYSENKDLSNSKTIDLANNINGGNAIEMIDIKKSGAVFKLQKTNADFTLNLPDSKFQLLRKEGNNEILVYPTDDSTFTIPENGLDLYEVFTDPANADKINTDWVKDGYLTEGLYKLDEITQPQGYDTYEAGFEFRVQKDGDSYTIVPVAVGSTSYSKNYKADGEYIYPADENGNKISSMSNVTKIEIDVDTDKGTVNIWDIGEGNTIKENVKKIKLENGIKSNGEWGVTADVSSNKTITLEFNGGFNFERLKIENFSPSNVKEVRIYCDENASSGGSSGGSVSSKIINMSGISPTWSETDGWSGCSYKYGFDVSTLSSDLSNIVSYKVTFTDKGRNIIFNDNTADGEWGSTDKAYVNVNTAIERNPGQTMSQIQFLVDEEITDWSKVVIEVFYPSEAAASVLSISRANAPFGTSVLKSSDIKALSDSDEEESGTVQNLSVKSSDVKILAEGEKSFGSVSLSNDVHKWPTLTYGDGNHTISHLYCEIEGETEIQTYGINGNGKKFSINNGKIDTDISGGDNSGNIQLQPGSWKGDGNYKVTYVKVTTTDGNVYVYDPNNTGGSGNTGGGEQTTTTQQNTPQTTTTAAPEGLTAVTATNEAGETVLQLPNEQAGDEIKVSVEKIWDVPEGYDVDFKTNTITVKLERYNTDGTKDTEFTADDKTLSIKNNWKTEWEKLPAKDSNGDFYTYKVTEVTEGINEANKLQSYFNIPTYSPADQSVSGGSNTVKITNSLKIKDITIEKQWLNSNGQQITDDSLLPETIQVKLQYEYTNANNETVWADVENGTYTLEKAENWSLTVEGLPATLNYKVVEVKCDGWTVNSEDTSEGDNKITITNTQQVGSLEVGKNWKDNNALGSRPDAIDIELYRSTVSPSSGSSLIDNTPASADGFDNYAKALQYSLYFFDAQMCGDEVGGENGKSVYEWRDNCHDDSTVNGGFHDAGDHTMFGLPQGFTASTLGWEYYEFHNAFDSLGQTEHYQVIMKEFSDFFAQCIRDNNGTTEVLVQKGDPNVDQKVWDKPENKTVAQYGGEKWVKSGSANIAAEYAASLASYVVNFPYDSDNERYLEQAKKLYNYAEDNLGNPHDYNGDPDNNDKDDMAWAAAWLYLATGGESSYKDNCSSYLKNLSVGDYGYYYGDVAAGAMLLYGTYIDENYDLSKVTNYLKNNCNDNTQFKVIADKAWGSIRHNALVQTIALIATKNIDNVDYESWCKSQMSYILGKNSVSGTGVCFITGFNEKSPKNLHHRAATGTLLAKNANDWGDGSKWAQWDGQYSSLKSLGGTPHTIVGALSGGRGNNGNYKDDGKEPEGNEVALDYQAGLVGAAAGLYQATGIGTLASKTDIMKASGNELRKVYDSEPVNVKVYTDEETIKLTNGHKGETKDSGVLSIGDERKLALENSTDNVTWTVENSADTVVASVDNKGILTALENGTATIKATNSNGQLLAEYALTVQIKSIVPDVTGMEKVLKDSAGSNIVISLNSGNSWSETVGNLPLYSPDGKKYYYYIKETTGESNTVAGKGCTYYPISYTNGVELNTSTNPDEFAEADVTNKKYDNGGVEMPSAGGKGTAGYYIFGALMIASAGAFLIIRRRKTTD